MELVELIEKWGDGPVLAACGVGAGLLFGFMAQRSRFCLRAAVLEFWHAEYGHKLVVWLLGYSLRGYGAGWHLGNAADAILGLAGRERSLVHAAATGRALSAIDPEYIGLLTLMLTPGTANSA